MTFNAGETFHRRQRLGRSLTLHSGVVNIFDSANRPAPNTGLG